MSFVNDQQGKRFNLQKKIKGNPKYKDVQPTIDTGASMTKYMKKIEDIRQNYKYRKDEIFKRMKVTTFVQLVIQVERISQEEKRINEMGDIPATPGVDYRPDTADDEIRKIQEGTPAPSLILSEGDYGYDNGQETTRSTLLCVVSGIGHMDIQQHPSERNVPRHVAEPVDLSCPYLLLDVRDSDEYHMFHIISSFSYPRANLSRATNYETREMLLFKNKPGKIIVLYDEDEKIAPGAATTLSQRGYDNLFMLSGGLRVAFRKFPEGLTTGTEPPSVSGHKVDDLTSGSQTSFTMEDVDKLDMYLDYALEDHSTSSASSRLSKPSSRASNVSRKSNASSMSQKRPFYT